jgi:hypothetical protein
MPMYWIYLILFVLAILIPDIIRGGFGFLSENRLEEMIIFLLGAAGFLIFIFKEHQLSTQENEGIKNKRKLFRATKDLAESYGYIGEVNRKMEILMQIGLGLADKSELTKNKEQEIYKTILNAANSLMRAKNSCLRFVDIKYGKKQKEVIGAKNCNNIKNEDLLKLGDKVNIKKENGFVIASSFKEIKNIKCFLIIDGYNEEEINNANNQDMLKFLASQGLFLYAYMNK